MSSIMKNMNIKKLKSLVSDTVDIIIPDSIKDTCTLYNNLSSYYFLTKRRKHKDFIPFNTLKTSLEKSFKRRITKEGVFSIHLVCPTCLTLEFTCFHENLKKGNLTNISEFIGLKFQPDVISKKDQLKTDLLNNFHTLHRNFIHNNHLLQYRFYYNKKGEFVGKHLHPKYKLENVKLFNTALKDECVDLNDGENYYCLYNLQDKLSELNFKNIVCKYCTLNEELSTVKKKKEIFKGSDKTKIIKNRFTIKNTVKTSLEKEVGKNLATKIIGLERDRFIKEEVVKEQEKEKEIKYNKDLEIKINNTIIRIFTAEKRTCIEEKELLSILVDKIKGYPKQKIDNIMLKILKDSKKFKILEHVNIKVVNYRP